MRIVFMGTPDYAEVALKKLIESEHEIVLVVTQPDKPVGRKQILTPPPVKTLALEHGLEVYQPERIKREDCVSYLRNYEADLFVVAAFGQILSQEILDMPRICCINSHASLLPEYRGAAPIQWSIVNGDAFTGVTIQRMNIGVDTGDIVSSVRVNIESDETGESLFDKLAIVGADLLLETIDAIGSGTATYTPQDESKATHVGMIKKEDGLLDFSMSARLLDCRIRGFYPWPCCYTYYGDKVLKIWSARTSAIEAKGACGEIVATSKDSFCVATGDGVLEITEVQLEGKKRMGAGDFMRGNDIKTGLILGL